MCKMIFIGISDQMQEIPWNDQNPSFFLQLPTSEEKAVINNFTQPYVYYIGTKRGCSCDFIQYSNTSNEEYKTERHALTQLLKSQVAIGNSVEVYCCWAGNYASRYEEKSVKIFSEAEKFYIDENEMVIYTSKQ